MKYRIKYQHNPNKGRGRQWHWSVLEMDNNHISMVNPWRVSGQKPGYHGFGDESSRTRAEQEAEKWILTYERDKKEYGPAPSTEIVEYKTEREE